MSGFPKNPWWNMISSIGKEGVDLARELLRFDPSARLSAIDVRIPGGRLFSSYRLSIIISSPSSLDQLHRDPSLNRLPSCDHEHWRQMRLEASQRLHLAETER